jgi:hypothetical protein
MKPANLDARTSVRVNAWKERVRDAREASTCGPRKGEARSVAEAWDAWWDAKSNREAWVIAGVIVAAVALAAWIVL